MRDQFGFLDDMCNIIIEREVGVIIVRKDGKDDDDDEEEDYHSIIQSVVVDWENMFTVVNLGSIILLYILHTTECEEYTDIVDTVKGDRHYSLVA